MTEMDKKTENPNDLMEIKLLDFLMPGEKNRDRKMMELSDLIPKNRGFESVQKTEALFQATIRALGFADILEVWEFKIMCLPEGVGFCLCPALCVYDDREILLMEKRFYIVPEVIVTLVHEICHAVCYELAGEKNHGSEWIKAMTYAEIMVRGPMAGGLDDDLVDGMGDLLRLHRSFHVRCERWEELEEKIKTARGRKAKTKLDNKLAKTKRGIRADVKAMGHICNRWLERARRGENIGN